MSRIILVRSPEATYPISLGYGLIDELGPIAQNLRLGTAMVLATDERVATLHADRAAAGLARAGF